MKILLINPPLLNTISSNVPSFLVKDKIDYLPPLGLIYLAGYLKIHTNHQIKILDSPVEKLNYENLKDKIIKNNPDIVGITALTFTFIDVIKTINIVKEVNENIKIILGGPHINIYPNETMQIKEIDFLVLGEGEEPFKDLLDNIHQIEKLYKIKGIVLKDDNKIINTGQRELINDLDSIPFPARGLLPYQKYFSIVSSNTPVTTMFTSRGCPFNCLFCDRPHLGKAFRARSAKNVVDEMEECQKMDIKEILIYDDTFTVNRQRVIDICLEIQKRNLNINWDVRARVDTVDVELLKTMKKSGCQRIHYGVEAGTQKILNILRKGVTLEQAKKAFRLSREIGLETLAYFMIGSPTETKEDILETIKFAKKLKPDYAHFAITTPFPATDLYSMGLKQNILPNDYWKKFAKNPQSSFMPYFWEENLNRKELIQLLKSAYYFFYLRPGYIFNKILKLKSAKELFTKAKVAFNILKI